jgi:hypothetical protein
VNYQANKSQFKPGHEKLSGRRRGTQNVISADYKESLIEAAHRIGADGGGKGGLVGYFSWVATCHPKVYASMLLGAVHALELAEAATPVRLRSTPEEIDGLIRDSIGKKSAQREAISDEDRSSAPWAWTGLGDPVGPLMDLAVRKPRTFCKLLAAVLPRPRPNGAGPWAPSPCTDGAGYARYAK